VRGDGTYGDAHAAHGVRTRRWATTSVSDDATRNGSTPMSTSRVTAATASLVCSVVSTRWPVSEALRASSAVSASRTSPTRTMSGSWRRMLRSPRAKVRPDSRAPDLRDAGHLDLDRVLEGDDVAVRCRDLLDAGVERVGLARAGRAGDEDQALRLHERVFSSSSWGAVKPVRLSIGTSPAGGSRRMTTFSPCSVGSVEMRASTVMPSTVSLARPSCGRRPLGDVEPGHDLDAADGGGGGVARARS
jgi:hypothetical protein